MFLLLHGSHPPFPRPPRLWRWSRGFDLTGGLWAGLSLPNSSVRFGPPRRVGLGPVWRGGLGAGLVVLPRARVLHLGPWVPWPVFLFWPLLIGRGAVGGVGVGPNFPPVPVGLVRSTLTVPPGAEGPRGWAEVSADHYSEGCGPLWPDWLCRGPLDPCRAAGPPPRSGSICPTLGFALPCTRVGSGHGYMVFFSGSGAPDN